ncbi:signal peptidase I [Paenarthrobacter sp. NPDC056912]|uniref:signal peptidase I n=1 Tax=Paenarthrobacter sp. NPDC056912 TaxID=3345965 RepID=UPI00366BC7C5
MLSKAAGRRRRLFRAPWMHVVLALVVVALVQGLFVKVYQVPSGSMEQTLNVGDRILVNRTAYASAGPVRGDVVVFGKPVSWGPAPERGSVRTALGWIGEVTSIGPGNTEYLVKRIIGLPGDTVACCGIGGQLQVNGAVVAESYIYQDVPFRSGSVDCSTAVKSQRCFNPIRLGEDQYLVMGDHRSNSGDSVAACRGAAAAADCVKTVQRADITGRVEWLVFPVDKWGGIK